MAADGRLRRAMVVLASGVLPALLVAVFSFGLLRSPVQLSDGIEPVIRSITAPSVMALMVQATIGDGHFRPWRFGQVKLVTDATSNLWLAFKLIHVALLALLVGLVVAVLKPVTLVGGVAAGAATVVLCGHHAFAPLMGQAYPINHFLQIEVACLLVLILARSTASFAAAALPVLFVFSLCTVETGLLVGACIVGAHVAGYPGASRRVVVVTAVIVLLYGVVRMALVAAPAPIERGSGFGMSSLSREQLEDLFAGRYWQFYLYNVFAAFSSILFAEPRSGTFLLFRHLAIGDSQPWMWIQLLSSTAATALVAAAGVSAWRTRRVDRGDPGLLLICAVVVVGNSVLSFPYLKDEMLSPGAVFYALAFGVAVRRLASAGSRSLLYRAVVGVALAVTCAGWSLRVAGNVLLLQHSAEEQRNEWAKADAFVAQAPDEARSAVRALQQRAVALRVPNTFFVPRWSSQVFDGRE